MWSGSRNGASSVFALPFCIAGDSIRLPRLEDQSLEDWWLAICPDQKRTTSAFLMYTSWNIWKERNRRIFDESPSSPAQVLSQTKRRDGF
ncbi:hypothetical protein BS78_09G191200 [Paspalum vaginatum]|nr:hypothetical protein BS78_09G191200 [Paspalum vaginatum]